jgi:hypothetical protein
MPRTYSNYGDSALNYWSYGDSALNYCTLGVTVRIPVTGASSPK